MKFFAIFGLVAATASVCMGQNSAPPSGPPGQSGPLFNPPDGPALNVPLNPQPGPALNMPMNPQSGPMESISETGVWPWPSPAGSGNEARLPEEMIGFGEMGAFGGGMFPTDSFRAGALWFPKVPVQGQPTDLQMIDENLFVTHPLWRDSLNAWSISAGLRNDFLQSDAILPSTGQPLPEQLVAINMGLHYMRQLDDGWTVGGGVSVGSASDHPFATIHELDIGMNAMLRIPEGDHNAWVFTLMYSPMSELNFPIPGVAFSFNPSPDFHANIGLPFSVMWRPTDDWQFQASYMLIRTVHLKAQFRIAQNLKAFAAYDWANEAYALLDRPDLNDRFFIYDQRASMGLQMTLWNHWTGTFSAGYVFGRYMFEGESYSGTDVNRVDLGSGAFTSLNLAARF